MKKYYILLLALGIAFSGCTYFKKGLLKTDVKIEERLKENNAAANISTKFTEQKIGETKVAIGAQDYEQAKLSIEGADAANSITSEFLRRNQNLIGLPIIDQTKVVSNLLSTNQNVRQAEEKKQGIKENEETNWRAKTQELESKLQAMGEKYEAERNKSIIHRIWVWGGWTLVLGSIVALMVFFPPLIPVFTMIVGKVISAIPSLAHVLGVVGKKTVESTIHGIGNVRSEFKKQKEFAPNKTYTPDEVLDMLDTQLKIATDKDDKKIIESFRSKLNV